MANEQICGVHHSIKTDGVCFWCNLATQPAPLPPDPIHPYVLTDEDRDFLRVQRINPEG